MKSRIQFAIFVFAVLIVVSGCSSAHYRCPKQTASFPWGIGNGRPLKVTVFDRPAERILKVTDNEREIFRFETADTFLGAIPLADQNGDLFTLWMGGSSYHFVVFSFQGGKISKTLETGSKLPPEFIFSGSENPRPFILVTDGLVTAEPQTWSSRIYYWSGKHYLSRQAVPFTNRLAELPD